MCLSNVLMDETGMWLQGRLVVLVTVLNAVSVVLRKYSGKRYMKLCLVLPGLQLVGFFLYHSYDFFFFNFLTQVLSTKSLFPPVPLLFSFFSVSSTHTHSPTLSIIPLFRLPLQPPAVLFMWIFYSLLPHSLPLSPVQTHISWPSLFLPLCLSFCLTVLSAYTHWNTIISTLSTLVLTVLHKDTHNLQRTLKRTHRRI